jgi:hypothetical protein
MDVNYEVVAKRGDITTPVKKVSICDTRESVVVNFSVDAAAQTAIISGMRKSLLAIRE